MERYNYIQIPSEEQGVSEKEKDERYELARFIYDYFEANVDRSPRFANILFYLLSPRTTAIGASRSYNIPSDLWFNFCNSVAESKDPNVLYDLREIAKMIKDGDFDF